MYLPQASSQEALQSAVQPDQSALAAIIPGEEPYTFAVFLPGFITVSFHLPFSHRTSNPPFHFPSPKSRTNLSNTHILAIQQRCHIHPAAHALLHLFHSASLRLSGMWDWWRWRGGREWIGIEWLWAGDERCAFRGEVRDAEGEGEEVAKARF